MPVKLDPRVSRLIYGEGAFARLDDGDELEFYAQPRLLHDPRTHPAGAAGRDRGGVTGGGRLPARKPVRPGTILTAIPVQLPPS